MLKRRYEMLLPLQHNDGRPVSDDKLNQTREEIVARESQKACRFVRYLTYGWAGRRYAGSGMIRSWTGSSVGARAME